MDTKEVAGCIYLGLGHVASCDLLQYSFISWAQNSYGRLRTFLLVGFRDRKAGRKFWWEFDQKAFLQRVWFSATLFHGGRYVVQCVPPPAHTRAPHTHSQTHDLSTLMHKHAWCERENTHHFSPAEGGAWQYKLSVDLGTGWS